MCNVPSKKDVLNVATGGLSGTAEAVNENVDVADYDPTTSDGLTNLATLGIGGGVNDVTGGDTGAETAQETEDFVTNQDEQDALEAAALAQEDAAKQGIAFAKEQYADFLGFTEPYREAGESFLPQLMEFLDPEVQAAFKAEALNSQEFQDIRGQAEEGLISNAAAFGGLRSSGTQDRLIRETSSLANQFGNQQVNNRLSQLQGGVNLGLGTLGTTISGLGQAGNQVQAGIANLGNAQASSAIAAGQGGFGFNDLLNFANAGANITNAYNNYGSSNTNQQQTGG